MNLPNNQDKPPLISPRTLRIAIAGLVLALGVAVCLYFSAPAPDNRGSIKGNVTIDDVPIEKGSILFMADGGQRIFASDAIIENGKYEIGRNQGPSVGVNKVEIRVQKKTGRKVEKIAALPGELIDEVVEMVAERFNVKTELRFEVKPGANTANFKVEAK